MTSDYQNPQFLSLLPDLTGEAGAECEIILPDYCPNVLRILQTTARPILRSEQTTGNRITVDGCVEYRVLYLAEDGSGMKSVTQQGQFSYAAELPEGTEDTQVVLQVRSVSARALNPKKIFVRSSVAITVRSCKSVMIKTPSLPQPCEVLVRREQGMRRVGSAKKPLRIADEFENDSGRIIGEILQWNIAFRETERKPLSDKLIVKGDMISELLCTNRDGAFIPIRKIFPISQILDLPDLTEGACFCTEFSLISASFLPREESPEGNQTVAYDVEIDVRADAYESAEFCRTEDAYGLRTDLDCKNDVISVDCIYPIDECGTVRETVETGICGEILRIDVTPELKSTRFDKEGDRIVCEGGWECRILMTDTDGIPCAVIREIPFTLHLPANDCTEPVRNDTRLMLSDLSWTRLDAERVELTGTYRWNGVLFHRKKRTILTEVSVSGDRKRSEEAVILYYAAAGESAWDIAKEHACCYDDFLKQNRLEDDRLNEDRMLMILSC